MDTGSIEFTCPRCTSSVDEAFYGPCTSCRAELRASQRSEQRDVATELYEPKVNVVPNAVASKD